MKGAGDLIVVSWSSDYSVPIQKRELFLQYHTAFTKLVLNSLKGGVYKWTCLKRVSFIVLYSLIEAFFTLHEGILAHFLSECEHFKNIF